MTQKNSFMSLLLQSIRGCVWGLALSVTLFFFSLPIYGAMQAGQIRRQAAYSSLTPAGMCAKYRQMVLGEQNYIVMFVVLILAVFFALNSFSYLFSRQKVDLYHALPIRRTRLFAANYLSGAIAFALPYLAGVLAAILVGAVNGMMGLQGVLTALYMFLMNTAGFLLLYAVCVIAVMLTGTLSVAIPASIILMLYAFVWQELINAYSSAFYYTYSSYGNITWLEKLSPFGLYIDAYDGLASNFAHPAYRPYMILILFVAAVLLTMIAAKLYSFRPSEAAGKAISFPKTMCWICLLIVVPCALYGGYIFYEMSGSGNVSWLIFGIAAALILSHCIVQAICYFDFKALLRNRSWLIAAGIISAVFAAVFTLDLAGYNAWIPDVSDLESAAIASYGLESNLGYYDFSAEQDETGDVQIWDDLMEYRLRNMKITDQGEVYRFVNNAIAEAETFHHVFHDGQEMDGSEETGWTSVTVKYNLKNGRSVFRQYTVRLTTEEMRQAFNAIYSDPAYKEGVFPVLSMTDEDVMNLFYYSPMGNVEVPDLTQDEALEIYNTYREELLSQDGNDVMDNVPIGRIYTNRPVEINGYVNIYSCFDAYIYPSFVKTIALLEEHGVDIYGYKDASKIDHIQVVRYDQENENTEDVISYDAQNQGMIYSDERDIAHVIQNAVGSDLVCFEGPFHETQAMDISVYYKDTVGYPATMTYEKAEADQ